MIAVTVDQLIALASEVELLKEFGRAKKSELLIDYLPARPAIYGVRSPEATQTEFPPSNGITLTYVLEEQMFGGVVYAAVTCQGHVIVQPFPWRGYDDLLTASIGITTPTITTYLPDGRHG